MQREKGNGQFPFFICSSCYWRPAQGGPQHLVAGEIMTIRCHDPAAGLLCPFDGGAAGSWLTMTTKCCVQVTGNTRMGSVRHRCAGNRRHLWRCHARETRHRTDSRVESARGAAASTLLHTRQDGHHGPAFFHANRQTGKQREGFYWSRVLCRGGIGSSSDINNKRGDGTKVCCFCAREWQ